MSPETFRNTLERLGLTRPEDFKILGVTSRQAVWQWATGKRAIPLHIPGRLRLIEHVGVDKARRILK